MSDFTEEVPGQIAAGINRLGDGKYTYYSIYELPADAEYDETVVPTEWIQATGVAPDRLTVEIKQADAKGVHRLYTVGRSSGATGPAAETEPIENGVNTYMVQPTEVLTAVDAIGLFQHYYDSHSVPSGWSLREQLEFSDTAVESSADQASAESAKPSTGRAPVADGDTARGGRTTTKAHKEGEPRR